MKRANLSEFKEQLEKLDRFDMQVGLILIEELLTEMFENEKDEQKKLKIATALFSSRHSSIPRNN